MSLISTESSLDGVFKQPSLVFPSLHNDTSHEPTSKYSYKNVNNNNNEDLFTNGRNFQSCIHYASRLIKLRSELRSPTYTNRSNGIGECGNEIIGKTLYKSKYALFGSNGRNSSLHELSATSKSSSHHLKNYSNSSPSLLSEIGRAQSLPNVASENIFDFDNEDESEIFSHHPRKNIVHTVPKKTQTEGDSDQDDGASQLTYLSDLVRTNLRRRQTDFHESRNHLALPPRYHFRNSQKESRVRSISLRDMINEAIDEAVQPTTDSPVIRPKVLKNSQSFTLASQLLYASSQNNCQRQTDHNIKGQKQKETAKLLLDDKNKEVINNSSNGAFDEKVEVSGGNHFLSPCSTGSCCEHHENTTEAIAPRPTRSYDSKSVFSSILSSDSELEEDDDDDTKTTLSVHSSSKPIIQERKSQKRSQALLVLISPSSAAAASVARSRRSKSKQTIRIKYFL